MISIMRSTIRSCKSSLIHYKGKWQENFSELQAVERFKKKIAELQDPTNVFSTLMGCYQSYEINPGSSAYSVVIKYLSHRCHFSQIPVILDHLEQDAKFDVPESIFVDLIRDYGKANMIQDAINIFYRIPKFRCTPSVLSLNSLLFLLCKRKEHLPLVRDILMKTPEMNIRLESSTFQILVGALCRNGKVSSALELMKLMQLDEYIPNAKIYSMVLTSLCQQANATEVLGFLEDMKNAGFLPTSLEYNSVIEVLTKEGKVNQVYSLLDQMKSEGMRPDVFSYNCVLIGFLLANDFCMVEELFDEILIMGLIPNISTFNIYLNSLCQQGSIERAHGMVSCMEKIACNPDTETFNVLLDGYFKAGDKEKCTAIKKEMVERGILWNSNTYRILIDAFLGNGDTIEAHKLFKEMLGKGFAPQQSTWNALVCRMCPKVQHSKAIHFLEELISKETE